MNTVVPNLTEVLLCARSYFNAFITRESWIRRLTHTFELVSVRSTCEKMHYEIDFSMLGSLLMSTESFSDDKRFLPLYVINRKSLTSVEVNSSFACKPALATREENTKVLLLIILGWVSFKGCTLRFLSDKALVDLYLFLLDPASYPLEEYDFGDGDRKPGSLTDLEPRELVDLFRISGFEQLLSQFRDYYLLVAVICGKTADSVGEFEISIEYDVLADKNTGGLLRKIAPIPMEWDVFVSSPFESLGEHVRVIPPSAARIVSCRILSQWCGVPGALIENEVKMASVSAPMKRGIDSLLVAGGRSPAFVNPRVDLEKMEELGRKGQHAPGEIVEDIFDWLLPFSAGDNGRSDVIVTDSVIALVRPHEASGFAPLRAKKVTLELTTKRRLFLTPAFFASLFSLIMTALVVLLPEALPVSLRRSEGWEQAAFVAAIVPPMVAGLVNFKLEDDLMTINLAFSRIIFTLSSFLLLFYLSAASQIAVPSLMGHLVFVLQFLVFLHFSAQLFFIWLYSNTSDRNLRRLGHVIVVSVAGVSFYIMLNLSLIWKFVVDLLLVISVAANFWLP